MHLSEIVKELYTYKDLYIPYFADFRSIKFRCLQYEFRIRDGMGTLGWCTQKTKLSRVKNITPYHELTIINDDDNLHYLKTIFDPV